MDVVYLVKRTSEGNKELRYSLRSLKNIQHDRVWIVGPEISWIRNVFNIDVSDDGTSFENVINKLKAVCNCKDVSDDFIFMHDDIFILKSLKKLKYYHRGPFDKQLKAIEVKFGHNKYRGSLNRVKEKFKNGLNYDLHIPIVFNKNKLKKIFELYPGSSGSKRSIYCNHWKVGGEAYPNGDCKVYGTFEKLDLEQEFLSVDDKIGNQEEFIKILEGLYPCPSSYEILDYYYYKMKKVKVRLLRSLYPYRAGEEAEMRFEVAQNWEDKSYLEIIEKGVVETKKAIENEKKAISSKTKNKSIKNKKFVKNK